MRKTAFTLLALTILACCLPALAQGPEPARGLITVGEEISLTLESEGLDRTISDQSLLVWHEEISLPGASYIAPHFSYFNLPDGAELIVRSPDGSRSWSFTGYGKAEALLKDGFWGIHIPGDTAVLELYSSVAVPEGAVIMDRFAHGYPDAEALIASQPFPDDAGNEAICGSDDSERAQCAQSGHPTIYSKSRAVARLLINGTGGCTGWLVGSQGHLVTNNHCIGNSSDALNTDYEFMAEGSCSTFCESFGACPGTVVATSATFIKTDVGLDYTLVRLPTNPTGTYGYLQMRNSLPNLNERIYIPGHPGAWGKRISIDSTHSSNPLGYCEIDSLSEPACTGGSVNDIGYFCDTRGGSSGSPVIATADHCVVSLHHCAYCENRGTRTPNIISDLGSSLPSNAVCPSCTSPPTTPGSIVGPSSLCPGAVGFYSASASTGADSYRWELVGTSWARNTSSPQTSLVPVYPQGYYTLRVRAYNNCGSSSWRTRTIYIKSNSDPTCGDCLIVPCEEPISE
ncbi:MAG: trypsin-like peptidase domain-containing protein [Acidobacteriota bacterium]|nr:trypsin-like peptidase domain-containing protein [Acidobacteriota bacterium]